MINEQTDERTNCGHFSIFYTKLKKSDTPFVRKLQENMENETKFHRSSFNVKRQKL